MTRASRCAWAGADKAADTAADKAADKEGGAPDKAADKATRQPADTGAMAQDTGRAAMT